MVDKEGDYLFYCRVCGLRQPEPPWGEYGDEPTYDICSCCGAESGFNDYSLEIIRMTREKWLKRGAPWRIPDERPSDWKLDEQLQHIPPQFL